MTAVNQTISLNNGLTIPLLGLGTWKSKANQIRDAIVSAIQVGYRHLDCAAVYGNEREVGQTLKEALDLTGIKRSDIFITSKLWNTMHAANDVLPAVQKTLADLQLEYLDLYLIHNPIGFINNGEMMPKKPDGTPVYSDVHYCETWSAMEKLVDMGLCKAIGLSNFNEAQVTEVMDKGRIKPAVLQSSVDCGDGAWRFYVIPIYLVIQNWERFISENHNRTIAQVALRFQVQRSVVAIPKSVTPKYIEENLQIFDFDLSEDDLAVISSLRSHRMCDPPAKGPDNKPLLDPNGRPTPRDKDHPFYPFQ